MSLKDECVFRHSNRCDHTDSTCDGCDDRITPIKGLSYRDHFEIFEKRRMYKGDRKLKWAAIIISILSLTISSGHILWQIYGPVGAAEMEHSVVSPPVPDKPNSAK